MVEDQEGEYLTSYQKQCMNKVGQTMQLEQQAYMDQHPEIKALLSLLISTSIRKGHKKNDLAGTAKFFTRPREVIDKEIREYLGLPSMGPYTTNLKKKYELRDTDNLELDLKSIKRKEFPPNPMSNPTSSKSSITTLSSSFLTLLSSDTTLPTPEPIPTPEPTLFDILYALVSNAVDKACFFRVTEDMILYDTAFVEIKKMIEAAMEVPIIEIRVEIACIFEKIWRNFEEDIMAKERIAAEIAWENRMRKKMKRTLRRVNNFKGYESSPSSRSSSDLESSEIDRRPPLTPCICHPQFSYNRYPKDRFGIYLPQDVKYSNVNTTVTPAFSDENIKPTEEEQ